MMLWIDDSQPTHFPKNAEVHRPVGRRRIVTAFHDIDGTHSCIRHWPPVMSSCLHDAIAHGLAEGYDEPRHIKALAASVGRVALPETDRFCRESAGLSALTQMEWAIRRGLQAGSISIPDFSLGNADMALNDQIIERIWNGEELFEIDEAPPIRNFLKLHAPRLFRQYEQVLNLNSRDQNLAAARRDPAAWRIPGSLEFVKQLFHHGVKNYFVTGAVVTPGVVDGIHEEILALGFDIGPGRLFEGIYGSRWNEKIPKSIVMQQLCDQLGIPPANLLVVGDGRAEIAVGVALGAVTVSCLPLGEHRQRDIHRQLGTNFIIPDYVGFLDALLAASDDREEVGST